MKFKMINLLSHFSSAQSLYLAFSVAIEAKHIKIIIKQIINKFR